MPGYGARQAHGAHMQQGGSVWAQGRGVGRRGVSVSPEEGCGTQECQCEPGVCVGGCEGVRVSRGALWEGPVQWGGCHRRVGW